MIKICTKCKQELPATLEYFHKNKPTKDGLCVYCKSCVSKIRKNEYPQNREKNIERVRKYREKNREKIRKYDRERNRKTDRVRNWRKTNPDRVRDHQRKGMAKSLGIKHVDWSEKELFERYGTNCYICNDAIDFTAPRKGPGSDWSSWPDHVIPVSRGGDNTIENVRPCHAKCNKNKKNKTYDEYMEYLKCQT